MIVMKFGGTSISDAERVRNVIRLVPTVWVYGEYEEKVADTIHDVTGWVMLPIAFLILLGIVKLLRWAMIPVTKYTLAYEA